MLFFLSLCFVFLSPDIIPFHSIVAAAAEFIIVILVSEQK